MKPTGSPFGSPARQLLLAGALGAALAACGGGDDRDADPVDRPSRAGDLPAGARVHSERGRITRVYGGPLLTGDSPDSVSERFVAEHSGALGARPADLRLARATQPVLYDRDTGAHKFSLITYEQRRNGVPVFEADVRMLVANRAGSPLVLVASALHDIGDFAPRSADAIVESAAGTNYRQTASAAAGAELTSFGELEAVVFAGTERTIAPVEAVTFVADNADQVDVEQHKWRFVVAAATGAVLHKENLIYTDVSGSVAGIATIDPAAMECSATQTRALPYAEVTSSTGGTAYTDADGVFALADSSGGPITVTSRIRGEYFVVDNYTGPEEVLDMVVDPDGTASFLHNSADVSDDVRAQVNVYVGANEIRDWVVRSNPDFPIIPSQTGMPIHTNRTDFYCPGNAWYDPGEGSINFCTAGSVPDYDFPNTAFASVIHHEYGHHVVQMGGSGQGAYGEGMSDVIAMLFSDDPRLGLGFFLGECENPLRTADNDCQYLEFGCSTCGSESHDCGRLLSGAVWSARDALAQSEPDDYLDLLSALAVSSIPLHQGTQITPQIAIDFLVLDDDDANIDNGTPHRDAICAGFDAHGLTCPELVNRLTITAPADIDEDAGVLAGAATVAVDVAPSTDMTVTLASSDTGELAVPATVIIAAGETSAAFDLTAVDDAVLDGSRAVTISATSSEAAADSFEVRVHDSETATLTIAIPASADEGDGTASGTVTLSAPAGEDLQIELTSSSPGDLVVAPSLTVPAGQTEVAFELFIVDDNAIDGSQTITITASVTNWTGSSADIEISDNEASALSLFVPNSVAEGAGVLPGGGVVQASGTVIADLVVQLGSSDEGVITVPASVTIPAGQQLTTFDVTVVDDTAIEGAQSATISASASGFSGASADIEVRDDDAHDYVGAPVPSPQTAGEPFMLGLTAVDESEAIVADYRGTATLTAVGDSGAHTVTPASIAFTNGTFSEPVTIHAVDSGVRITATGADGLVVTTNAFEVRGGPVDSFAVAAISSPQHSHTPFDVVISAIDANGYPAAGFTGSVNLSSWASVASPVVISEIDLGSTDRIELHNVTAGVVDTSGWRVVVSDSYTDPQTAATEHWFLPVELAADEIVYATDNTTDEYFGANIRWSDGEPGWALLLDDQLAVVDFVVWGWNAANIATIAPSVDATTVPVSGAFIGDGAPFSGAGTLQRIGSEDRDRAADFVFDTPSIGSPNANMVTPFVVGVTGVTPAQTDAFTAGVWSGPVTFAGESSAAVLLVNDGAGHLGVSNSFALDVALVCASQPCSNGGACIPDGDASFTCECAAGWDGATCDDDIDECATSADDCDANATCTNEPGGFSCACNAGYSGDGTSCAVVCGDGQVGPDEECDDGPGNSDTEPDACRTDCTAPSCGDGILDQGETCDDGTGNSDAEPDACRTNCAVASCGDGALDDGEVCDDGTGNSDTAPDACRTTCAEAFCGDGVTDSAESCDDGSGNSDTTADACRSDCSAPTCGDGVVDSSEECDEGGANVDGEPDQCNTSCEITEDSGGCRASTGGADGASALLVLGLFAAWRRRRKRR